MRRVFCFFCSFWCLLLSLHAQHEWPKPEGILISPTEQADFSRDLLPKVVWQMPRIVTAAPKATLFAVYGKGDLRWHDHVALLATLQERFAAQELRIAVVVAKGEAKLLCESKPPFAVGELAVPLADYEPMWLDCGEPLLIPLPLDVAADVFAAVAAGQPVGELLTASEDLEDMLSNVGDGISAFGLFDTSDAASLAAVLSCLEKLPHSGRAHALRVLMSYWCRADLPAARQYAMDSVRDLAEQPWALIEFSDLVLRCDEDNVEIGKQLAFHLAHIAAAAPDSIAAQLVYLRALLRTGQDQIAGRMLLRLAKLVANSTEANLWFAETLMEAAEATPYREFAEQALAAAAKLSADPRLLFAARHKVRVQCGAEPAESAALMAAARKALGEGSAMWLNDDAWYLMTSIATMGRFDSYALAQCEELARLAGDHLNNEQSDTLALAMFLNRRVQAAIDLQTEVVAASQQDPDYVLRLRRYQQTLSLRAKKK